MDPEVDGPRLEMPILNNTTVSHRSVYSDIAQDTNSTDVGDAPTCRICMGGADEGRLFSPCLCKGSMRFVHVHCLQRWRQEKETHPSFYRCDQCHYNYNMRRVDAAGILGHPYLVEATTVHSLCPCYINLNCTPSQTIQVILLILACSSSALFFHLVAPDLEVIPDRPLMSSVLLGLLFVGLSSFVGSFFIPGCSRARQVGDCNVCNSCHFPIGLPFEVSSLLIVHRHKRENADGQAGEFFFIVAIFILAYIVIVGVLRAVIFTYGAIHSVARGGADIMETTVSLVQPPVNARNRSLGAGPGHWRGERSSWTRRRRRRGLSTPV